MFELYQELQIITLLIKASIWKPVSAENSDHYLVYNKMLQQMPPEDF